MVLGSGLLAAFELQTLPEQLVNGLQYGAVYALMALGYTMVYGVLRLINFAHGEIYMLGAYTALFVSWAFGFSPAQELGTQTNVWIIIAMLAASMAVSALFGVIIERFAYRPMRSQPRIAALITAIGVSLLLQYGGQLFLPNSPAPNVSQRVNPFPGAYSFTLKAADPALTAKAESQQQELKRLEGLWTAQQIKEKDTYNPSPEGKAIRDAFFNTRATYDKAVADARATAITVGISKGYVIIFVVTLVLMAALRHLVLFTKAGRAMRAVSHDFDSASLMGINVNKIVTLTFVIGSSLAGAAAMLSATFQAGIKIDTFFGLLPGVKAFVAAVLGGIGNIPGAVLGGFLMGLTETMVVWGGGSDYKDAVAFVILILVLLVRPGGLLGSAKVEKV